MTNVKRAKKQQRKKMSNFQATSLRNETEAHNAITQDYFAFLWKYS